MLESRRIPINSRQVVGAKVLPGAIGTSSSVNKHRMLQRAVRQFDRGGLVTKKKSSRMWITSGIPHLALMIHSIMQENWSKRKGALRKPKGRTVSK